MAAQTTSPNPQGIHDSALFLACSEPTCHALCLWSKGSFHEINATLSLMCHLVFVICLTAMACRVEALIGRGDIMSAALGSQHTLFLDSKGTVFSCGENKEVSLDVPVLEATLALRLFCMCAFPINVASHAVSVCTNENQYIMLKNRPCMLLLCTICHADICSLVISVSQPPI